MSNGYHFSLETALVKVYESRMDDKQRIEMLERALEIMACPLATDAINRERLIRVAKVQALEDMLLSPVDPEGK